MMNVPILEEKYATKSFNMIVIRISHVKQCKKRNWYPSVSSNYAREDKDFQICAMPSSTNSSIPVI
jgi:hypothetical protein